METVHDIRARKRTEIGLSPNRPTAHVVLQRPPPESQTPTLLRWILVGLLLAMVCATALLMVARFFNSPTSWPWLRDNFVASSPYQLAWKDTFSPPHLALASGTEGESPYKWFNPQEGVYRMSVGSGETTISTIGLGALGPHRVEIDLKIIPERGGAEGYAGLLTRYQNKDNSLLFLINSQGQFQVQSRQNGEWFTHQSWATSSALNLAPIENTLVIEDRGAEVHLYGNDRLLLVLSELQLEAGDIGLVGGTPTLAGAQSSRVQIDFSEIRFFEPASE